MDAFLSQLVNKRDCEIRVCDTRACFLSLAWSKLRLCSANHRADYFSNHSIDLLACMTEIVWMTSKNYREPLLFSAHHFKAIGKFKQDLKPGNAQFYSIFCLACATLKLMDGLENNRVPLLCYFKLCGSFHNHR